MVEKKAFTLIELLVTIVLFSLLLGTALYSFRFISINIKNINNTNPKTAIYYSLIRDSIASMYFYVEVDEKTKNPNKKFYHYFEGKKDECFFITSSAFFSRELSMVHLFYSKKKLWYEEGKIFGDEIDYKNLNSIPLNKKLLLLDNVKKLSFTYFINDKKYQTISRKIPDLIQIKIEHLFNKKEYMFSIKSHNSKHLAQTKRKEFF